MSLLLEHRLLETPAVEQLDYKPAAEQPLLIESALKLRIDNQVDTPPQAEHIGLQRRIARVAGRRQVAVARLRLAGYVRGFGAG